MTYTIIISKTVKKQINDLPDHIKKRVIEKIKNIAQEVRPVNAIKLKGFDQEYRLRIGDYRLRYEIDDSSKIIKLLQCKHRREIYRQ
jgi:mRNA interferase RelE/StbE